MPYMGDVISLNCYKIKNRVWNFCRLRVSPNFRRALHDCWSVQRRPKQVALWVSSMPLSVHWLHHPCCTGTPRGGLDWLHDPCRIGCPLPLHSDLRAMPPPGGGREGPAGLRAVGGACA